MNLGLVEIAQTGVTGTYMRETGIVIRCMIGIHTRETGFHMRETEIRTIIETEAIGIGAMLIIDDTMTPRGIENVKNSYTCIDQAMTIEHGRDGNTKIGEFQLDIVKHRGNYNWLSLWWGARFHSGK
jgi:hypothetical protein